MVFNHSPPHLPAHGRRRFWPQETFAALWVALLTSAFAVYEATQFLLLHTAIEQQRPGSVFQLVWQLLPCAAACYAYVHFTRQIILTFDYSLRTVAVCHWHNGRWQETHRFALDRFQALILRENDSTYDVLLAAADGRTYLLAERFAPRHRHQARKQIRRLQSMSGLPYRQQDANHPVRPVNAWPDPLWLPVLLWLSNCYTHWQQHPLRTPVQTALIWLRLLCWYIPAMVVGAYGSWYLWPKAETPSVVWIGMALCTGLAVHGISGLIRSIRALRQRHAQPH